jgi:hypothetical protein
MQRRTTASVVVAFAAAFLLAFQPVLGAASALTARVGRPDPANASNCLIRVSGHGLLPNSTVYWDQFLSFNVPVGNADDRGHFRDVSSYGSGGPFQITFHGTDAQGNPIYSDSFVISC